MWLESTLLVNTACVSLLAHTLYVLSSTTVYTLHVLLIEDSMRMHWVVPGRKVLQVDHDNVIDLSSQYGPEEAQPGGSGGQAAVRVVRVLSEHGLLINTADTLGSSLQEHRCMPEIQVETEKWLERRKRVCRGQRQPLSLICCLFLKVKVELVSYYTIQGCTMTCSLFPYDVTCIFLQQKKSMKI